MKRFLYLSIFAVPFFLFAQGTPVMSGNPPSAPMPVMEQPAVPQSPFLTLADKLGLDEKTTTKIEDLWYKHQKEMLDIRYKIEKAELDLRDYVRSEKFNTTKFMTMWKNIQKMKDEQELKNMEFKVKIYRSLPKDKLQDAKWILFDGHRMLRRFMEKKRIIQRKRIMMHK